MSLSWRITRSIALPEETTMLVDAVTPGLLSTHKERFNADLLDFTRQDAKAAGATTSARRTKTGAHAA